VGAVDEGFGEVELAAVAEIFGEIGDDMSGAGGSGSADQPTVRRYAAPTARHS
jgi:hypothetical protein